MGFFQFTVFLHIDHSGSLRRVYEVAYIETYCCTLDVSLHLTLSISLWGKYYYCLNISDEEFEGQRVKVSCLRSHS